MTSRWTNITARVLATAVLFSSVGCYRATFYRDPKVQAGEEHDEWTDFFLFGLVGSEQFEIQRFCPAGQVAEVKTGANFGTAVVSLLTIGIYMPRKVYVTCAAGGAASVGRELELDLSQAGTPVRANLRLGSNEVVLNIDATGPTSWRLSPGANL